MSAIKMLKEGCALTNPQRTLVENIHQVHQNSDSVEWQHVYREANQVADRLTKHVLSLDEEFKIFNFVPGFIFLELFVDNACVTFS
jgi:hypothetical protein